MRRKIIHVDMDAFFAAVEQRDNPELKGKPVVIGGPPNSRGVVSTASYEARKFGIRSAMPVIEAYRRCPQAIFIKPSMRKYQKASQGIMAIFHSYTPLVEAISLDEAFLDVTGSIRLFGDAEKIGWEIKHKIKEELNLTASIGIAYNKFLAKLASDMQKPDGLVVIKKEELTKKIWPLPVERLWGIGKKSTARLKELNIKTIGQLAKAEPSLLTRLLGSWGFEVQALAKGFDERPVIPEREAKSMGHEMTFSEDINNMDVLEGILLDMSQDVGWRLRRNALTVKTIVLKLRFDDFRTITRSHTLLEETDRDDIIYQEVIQLLRKNYDGRKKIRLIGVTATGVENKNRVGKQFTLFTEGQDKGEELYRALDKINSKYGKKTVTRARLINKKNK